MTTEPTVQHDHHRSARERQRRGPMWGCLRWIAGGFVILAVLLVLLIGGGWWYLGTTSFADLVKLRIANTLETKLGRHVDIGDVDIVRGRESQVILKDLRIANAPGAMKPYFATVKQLVITGGVDSFWGRRIRVGRIDVVEPRINFEIFPPGAPLVHNFPHWQSGPPRRYEIYHLDPGTIYVRNGTFDFNDRRHNVGAIAAAVDATIKVTSQEDLYAGTMTSPQLTLRIQDYAPFNTAMRGDFRYAPNVLDLRSVALDGGPDMKIFLRGRVAPLADAVYNLRVQSRVGLNRVREIFRVQKVLDGPFVMDANLAGRAGTFKLTGGWVSPKVDADVYTLTNARGRLDVTDVRSIVDVERAQYGGGTLAAHYVLPQYAEPYPMSVDLRYNGVSVEKLFANWSIPNPGLSGAGRTRLPREQGQAVGRRRRRERRRLDGWCRAVSARRRGRRHASRRDAGAPSPRLDRLRPRQRRRCFQKDGARHRSVAHLTHRQAAHRRRLGRLARPDPLHRLQRARSHRLQLRALRRQEDVHASRPRRRGRHHRQHQRQAESARGRGAHRCGGSEAQQRRRPRRRHRHEVRRRGGRVDLRQSHVPRRQRAHGHNRHRRVPRERSVAALRPRHRRDELPARPRRRRRQPQARRLRHWHRTPRRHRHARRGQGDVREHAREAAEGRRPFERHR